MVLISAVPDLVRFVKSVKIVRYVTEALSLVFTFITLYKVREKNASHCIQHNYISEKFLKLKRDIESQALEGFLGN